jgi:hypothetical protein
MRLHSAMLTLLAAACGSSAGTGPEEPPPNAGTLFVLGGAMGPRYQNIYVSRDDLPVSGATVTVNGVAIPEVGAGQYYGPLPDFLTAGASIVLVVQDGNQTVTGTATLPGEPVLQTPSPNFTAAIGSSISYEWTSPGSPSRFYAGFLYRSGNAGSAQWEEVGGSVRAASVKTSGLPANATEFQAFVNAYADGTFTGPAHPDSRMNVRVESGYRPITLTP